MLRLCLQSKGFWLNLDFLFLLKGYRGVLRL